MKTQETKNRYSQGRNAFVASGSTLMEVLIASSIGVLVLAALIALMTTQVQEQRKEMVDSNLQQQANLLEDKITRLFRSMSAGQAAILGNPIAAGSPFYHLIVVARGSAPIAREQVAFDSATFTCASTPNLAVPATREIYFGQSKLAVLRELYFFISQKNDGASDASAITVFFKMDDNGMGHRGRTNVLVRSFTTTMRNN
jgi:Tfp pilus assembly protein PilE